MTLRSCVSIDVDSIATHLQGYGVSNYQSSRAPVYETAIPRALEIFSEEHIRATFFLVANEVREYPGLMREIVDAGHEVASHSATHPLPFPANDAEKRAEEILGSKKTLEDLSGEAVVGFRAPSWDMSDPILAELIAAGYHYDASLYPSWAAFALRLAVRMKSSGSGTDTPLPPLKTLWSPRTPFTISMADGNIAEFPVSVMPWTRLPYYHTMSFMLPKPIFSMVERATLNSSAPVSYILHGVDFLDLDDPGVPSEFSRHPGMNLKLNAKVQAVRTRLRALSQGRESCTLRDLLVNVSQ